MFLGSMKVFWGSLGFLGYWGFLVSLGFLGLFGVFCVFGGFWVFWVFVVFGFLVGVNHCVPCNTRTILLHQVAADNRKARCK